MFLKLINVCGEIGGGVIVPNGKGCCGDTGRASCEEPSVDLDLDLLLVFAAGPLLKGFFPVSSCKKVRGGRVLVLNKWLEVLLVLEEDVLPVLIRFIKAT